MERDKETKSLSDLFTDFTNELRMIVSDEVQLVKSEMSKKVSDTLKDAVYLGIGAILLFTGLLAVVATIMILLALTLPWWLAALIVTVVVSGIGFLFLQKGIADLKQRSLTPEQTIETLKEDRTWVKNRIP